MPLRLLAFLLAAAGSLTTCSRADAGAWFNYPFLTRKERDNETGLDYFLARYYSSMQGRFTSVDPENAGAFEDEPQSWNGYAYVQNNPLGFIDPDGLERCGIKNADGSCAEWVGDFDGERSKEISGGIYKDGAYWNDEQGIWETRDQYRSRTWDPLQEFVNEVARRTEWMEPFGEVAVDLTPVPGPKIGTIKRVSKATGIGWKLLKVARPLKKMGHAAKHLKDFQKIDSSLSADDVAKILEHVRQVGKSSPTAHGGKLYEAAVDIGGKSVNVKVVESAGGVIKTGFPVQ